MKTVYANAWLRPAPDAPPDRQVLFGDAFEMDRLDGRVAYGRAAKDGYRGCLPAEVLGPLQRATHFVSVRSTWAFAAADIKSEPLQDLHLTSRITVQETTAAGWHAIALQDRVGYLPVGHCRVLAAPFADPVKAARLLLGVPYVWAGNAASGLDCSGFVQAVYRACGWDCAADSQDQAAMPGQALGADDALEPGDLIFWKDHVVMATGRDTIIHANAHHMCVAEELTAPAFKRIAATDTGPVTLRLRPERRPIDQA